MRKIFTKQNILKFILLNVGIFGMATGGVFFVKSNIGSDALMVMNQGIAVALNLELGYGVIIGNVVALILMIIFDRKDIGLATILIAILTGQYVNLIQNIGFISSSTSIIQSLLYILIGELIGGFSIALYILSKLGLSPFEALNMVLSQKKNISFGKIKVITDASMFTLGFVLGGKVGIGSIIIVLTFGPLIDIYLKFLKKTRLVKYLNK